MKLSSTNKSFEENLVFTLAAAAFAYFFFRLLYFALHISPYVPPDEISHIGLCKVFAKSLFLPQESEETYSAGLVTHVPYLYYFIMGKCLNLNIFPVSDLMFLRLTNCVISFGTVVYGYRWIQLLTPNRFCHLLFLFLLTNTPMFSFVSAFVSYDNLNNLFAAAALYHLHCFFRKPNAGQLLLFGISLLGGILSKKTFIPLVPIFLGILVFHERNHLKHIFSVSKNALLSLSRNEKILLGIFLILLVLNLKLYGENLIRFKKIIPERDQILTEEQSMKYRVYARNRLVSLYQSGQLIYEEAVEKAIKIRHPGDRNDALNLLKIAQANRLKPILHVDRIQYAWIWLRLMLERSVSIAAHIFMEKSDNWIGIYQLFFLLSLFLFIRHWQTGDPGYYLMDAFFICFFYALVLMQLVNYPMYMKYHSVGLALQGRYFFQAIIPFYGIVAYFLIIPFGKPLQIIIFALISLFFVLGDFTYFLQHASQWWFFS